MDGPTMSDPTLRLHLLNFVTGNWMGKAEKRAQEGKLKLRLTTERWTNRGEYVGGGLFIWWGMKRRSAGDHLTPFERHKTVLYDDEEANGQDPGRVTAKQVRGCCRAFGCVWQSNSCTEESIMLYDLPLVARSEHVMAAQFRCFYQGCPMQSRDIAVLGRVWARWMLDGFLSHDADDDSPPTTS